MSNGDIQALVKRARETRKLSAREMSKEAKRLETQAARLRGKAERLRQTSKTLMPMGRNPR